MKQTAHILLLLLIPFIHCYAGGGRRDMRSFRIVCETRKVKPGEKVPIELEVKRKNGRTYIAPLSNKQSEKLKEKQKWGDFDVRVRGGEIEDGVLTVSRDMRSYADYKTVEVTITHKVIKKQSHTLNLTIDYSGDTEANFGGEKAGVDGKKGSMGIRLFLQEGVDGGDGEHGTSGDSAEDIIVYIKRDTTFTNDTFLRVYVKRIKEDTSVVFVHNIQRHKLIISANGANGGNGGKGGHGSGGRNARDASNITLGRPAGTGGRGGKGGDAGNGGNSGAITVYLENDLLRLVNNKIFFENKPGKAGKPGKGGKGGSGGFGSLTYNSGRDGENGPDGQEGTDGESAPRPQIFNVEKIELKF